MPKVSDDHRQSRREQILDAAVNCFIRNGFHHTSMRDICQEAGLSSGAIYLQFKSKEEIIEASWQRAEATRARRFEDAKQLKTSSEAMVNLNQYFVARLQTSTPDRAWQLWLQMIAESQRNPEIRKDICQKWQETSDQISKIMREGWERGEFESGGRWETFARMYIALHDGLVLQKIINPEKNVLSYLQFFNELLAGYKPPSSVLKRRTENEQSKIT
jgi:AcrR family transcriptional regulator